MHTKIGRDCSICSGGTCAIVRCRPCQAAARLRPPPRLAQFPLETCSNPSPKYSYQRQKIMLAFAPGMYYNIFVPFAGVMESVDVVDSKSTAGDSVPVRVRPPAPKRKSRRASDGIFALYDSFFSFQYPLQKRQGFVMNTEDVRLKHEKKIYACARKALRSLDCLKRAAGTRTVVGGITHQTLQASSAKGQLSSLESVPGNHPVSLDAPLREKLL